MRKRHALGRSKAKRIFRGSAGIHPRNFALMKYSLQSERSSGMGHNVAAALWLLPK